MRYFIPKSFFRCIFWVSSAAFSLSLFSETSYAQEAIRPSEAGTIAFRHMVDQIAGPSSGGDNYNFRIGQSLWYLDARMAVEYNSNINLSQTNPLPDIILRPAIDLRFYWQVTRQNYLAGKFSFEYDRYISNPTYNQFGLGVDPDTILEYNFFIKDFKIRIYDRPSTQRNAANDSTLSNVQNYSFFTNVGGLSVLWDLNDVIFNVGLERIDQRSMNSNFEGLNNTTYSAYFSSSVKITPTLFVGFRTSVAQTSYEDSVLNDNRNATVGLFAQGRLSPLTSFRVEGGLQQITFSDTGDPTAANPVTAFANPDGQTNVTTNSEGGNFLGPYFTLGVDNRLNRYFTHGVNLSMDAVPGTASNYVYLYGLDYNLSWNVNRQVNVSFSPFYQYGIQSGTIEAERYQQYGARIRVNYFFVNNINLYTELGTIVRVSDIDDRSYNQFRFLLGIQYAF